MIQGENSSDFSLIVDLSLIDAPVPPLVSASANWRYFKGSTAPAAGWQTLSDAALGAAWLTGAGGFGYGDGDDATVLGDMRSNYTTVYIRQTFAVPAPYETNLHLFLKVDYDDGYVAYLDGIELDRQLVPGTPGSELLHTATASTTHEASAGASGNPPRVIDLGPATNLLPAGQHILALIGVNESADSSDLSLIAELSVAVPPPPPPGSITEDTTWTVANSPYIVTNDITVAGGVTLTLEPGVTVLFNTGRGMIVNGRLLAEGNPENPIVFTRNGGSGTWNHLLFNANNSTSIVTHAVLSYFGSSAFEAHGTALHLDSIVWTNSTQAAVDLHDSSIVLLNSHIPGGAGNEPVHFSGMPANGHALIQGCVFGAPQGYNDSIDFTGGNRPGPIAQFLDNVFLAAVDDCFDMDATDAHIEGNIFMNVLQDAQRDSSSSPITTGEGSGTSELVICRNIFFNCEHTLLVKDAGSALMQNNTIVHLVSNSTARTSSGNPIPPGIILFGEPWRGSPLGAGVLFEGNIAWDLHPAIQAIPFPIYNPASQFFLVSQSDLQGIDWPGPGNLSADPMFVNLAGPMTPANIRNNLTLLAGSPCVGTGPNGLDRGALVPSGASISGEPSGVTTNTSATLTVAGPGVYAYKWKLNNGPWSQEIPLTNSLLINPTLFANAQPILLNNLTNGSYTIYAIGKNSAGAWQPTDRPTASKTWTVQKEGFLEITGIAYDSGVVTFQFQAQVGQTYTVQYRESLTDGSWGRLVDIPAQDAAGPFLFQDVSAGVSTRFYRVVSPSPQ